MIRQNTLAMLTLMVFGLASSLACHLYYDCGDEDITPVESGDYTVANRAFGPDEQEWLIGAQLTIDRDMGIVILRYTRDDTMYEAHYAVDP